jgi:hypothetical protein
MLIGRELFARRADVPVIPTKIDTQAQAFARNTDVMKRLLVDLRGRLETARAAKARSAHAPYRSRQAPGARATCSG